MLRQGKRIEAAECLPRGSQRQNEVAVEALERSTRAEGVLATRAQWQARVQEVRGIF